jgi:hypothetical protein
MKSNNVQFAHVQFSETPGTNYCFLTEMKVLKRGDQVVVDTAYGLKVAEFVEYVQDFPFAHARRAKWIIQKVDTTKLQGLRTTDVSKVLESSEKARKRVSLEAKLEILNEQFLTIKKELAPT